MASIKLTSKRQATLPVELCREMGIKPGDELKVEKRLVGRERVWTLRPASNSLDWYGSLSEYAKGKSHDLSEIRKSIGKGLGKEKFG